MEAHGWHVRRRVIGHPFIEHNEYLAHCVCGWEDPMGWQRQQNTAADNGITHVRESQTGGQK